MATVLVFGRGFTDYEWFVELTQQKVWFVTRLKDNAVYEVVERREVLERGPALRDEVIYFPLLAQPEEEYFFRRVEVWDEAKGESIVSLTNHKQFGPDYHCADL